MQDRIAPDGLLRRGQFRAEYLAHAEAAAARGELVLGGAAGEPPDCAVPLFAGSDAAAVQAFARTDPYVREGLVTGWTIKPWHTVVGPQASQRVAAS